MAEDISPDVIKKTQKILGKYVKKPALNEKLLKKPPFRFLHDVVISVIKETGFLKGLFSVNELTFENVKEKEAKVAFLNKLIDAVKTITKTELTARASKIVAGLEPTKTNLLLQAIGKAIDEKMNASEYISQLNSGQIDATENKVKKSTVLKDDKRKIKIKDDSSTRATKTKKVKESPNSKTKISTPKESSRDKIKSKSDYKNKISSTSEEKPNEGKEITTEISTPKANANTNNNITNNDHIINTESQSLKLVDIKKENKEAKPKEQVDMEENSNISIDTNLNIINNEKKQESNENLEKKEIKNDVQIVARPKSARPKKVDVGSTLQKKAGDDQDAVLKPLQTVNQPLRPKSSLRPPSVRPSSARPGAPRLKSDSTLPLQETIAMGNINVIVENMDNNVDDEETVVIQTTSDVAEENLNPIEVPQDNKGQLVEQILEQIQEEGEGVKKKVDIDWEQDGLHNKDGTAKEINQLRSLIQTLTRTANPLGKLLNYLHEDIDAMHGELQMWTNVKNQLFSEIQQQKRVNIELNKPLLTHLEHLQEDIKKQQLEIVTVRSNVLRNELRIKELLDI